MGNPGDGVFWRAVRDAFAHFKVLFFPEQTMTPDTLVAFARHFGPIGHYPFAAALPDHPDVIAVIKEPHQTANFGGLWHTDTPYLPEPSAATVLYAVEVPEMGGDTLWADAVAALEALDPETRRLIEGRTAIHTAGKTKGVIRADTLKGGAMQANHEDEMDLRQATHPVIRTHAVTGEQSLFVSPAHTVCLSGMTEAESAPILDRLFDHVTQEQFCIRHHWRAGTVAIWDNTATLHYPLNDYHGHRREMLRVSIAGGVPV